MTKRNVVQPDLIDVLLADYTVTADSNLIIWQVMPIFD